MITYNYNHKTRRDIVVPPKTPDYVPPTPKKLKREAVTLEKLFPRIFAVDPQS